MTSPKDTKKDTMSNVTKEMPKADAEKEAKVARLCKFLSNKPSHPIRELPAELQEVGVLHAALTAGYIEIGRRDHVWTNGVVNVTEDRSTGAQTVRKENRLIIGENFEWTDLKGKAKKTLAATLAEDAELNDPKLKLHARVTNDGLGLA